MLNGFDFIAYKKPSKVLILFFIRYYIPRVQKFKVKEEFIRKGKLVSTSFCQLATSSATCDHHWLSLV